MYGYTLSWMSITLFNFKGWKRTLVFIIFMCLIFITDFILLLYCVDHFRHSIFITLAEIFYVTILYIAAICFGIDRKTSNLVYLVFFIMVFLCLNLHLINDWGFTMLFGYSVILLDSVARKVLFAF